MFQSLKIALNVPIIISIITFAWSLGFLKGLIQSKNTVSVRKYAK